MAEETHPAPPQPGEVLIRDAVEPSGYSHSYIIQLIKGHHVKGRLVKTEVGSHWLVALDDLLRYKNEPHKPGPKRHTFERKKKTGQGEPHKTEAAA